MSRLLHNIVATKKRGRITGWLCTQCHSTWEQLPSLADRYGCQPAPIGDAA